MRTKLKKSIQPPFLGQYVRVLFLSLNSIPVTFVGKCIDIRWRGSNTTFTLIYGTSQQMFMLFSPNTLEVSPLISRLDFYLK